MWCEWGLWVSLLFSHSYVQFAKEFSASLSRINFFKKKKKHGSIFVGKMLRDDYEFTDTRKNKTVNIKPHHTQFYPWEKEWEVEGSINASHTMHYSKVFKY